MKVDFAKKNEKYFQEIYHRVFSQNSPPPTCLGLFAEEKCKCQINQTLFHPQIQF
jgi:hypothetical protein